MSPKRLKQLTEALYVARREGPSALRKHLKDLPKRYFKKLEAILTPEEKTIWRMKDIGYDIAD